MVHNLLPFYGSNVQGRIYMMIVERGLRGIHKESRYVQTCS